MIYDKTRSEYVVAWNVTRHEPRAEVREKISSRAVLGLTFGRCPTIVRLDIHRSFMTAVVYITFAPRLPLLPLQLFTAIKFDSWFSQNNIVHALHSNDGMGVEKLPYAYYGYFGHGGRTEVKLDGRPDSFVMMGTMSCIW